MKYQLCRPAKKDEVSLLGLPESTLDSPAGRGCLILMEFDKGYHQNVTVSKATGGKMKFGKLDYILTFAPCAFASKCT